MLQPDMDWVIVKAGLMYHGRLDVSSITNINPQGCIKSMTCSEGTKYTVRCDARFGTYETRTDDDGGDAVNSAWDDSDPFAIFGGYAQYELFHLLATSTMSKAFISKYLELQIWVRIRLDY